MNKTERLLISLAGGPKEGEDYYYWWDTLTPEAQKQYLKEHPASKLLNTVPKEVGETPIPKGMERRFHYTRPDRIKGIIKEGLQVKHSNGHLHGDPNGIWSEGEKYKKSYADMDRPVIEFYDDPENWKGLPYSFKDIPPEQIVAIHHGWHKHYRYIKENKIPLSRLEKMNLQDDYAYGPAYKQLKREGYK